MGRRGTAGLVVLALLGALLASPGVVAQEASGGYTATSTEVRAEDGTPLGVDVFRPGHVGDAATPVAMVISPYLSTGPLGTSGEPQLTPWVRSPDLVGAGYTVVQASLRGFGRSGGCIDWGGPKDLSDVRTLVEWAADQPWSTGSVAVLGNSYEAWAGVMALAADPRGLAAVVLSSPLIDGYRAFYLDGVRYGHVWHATPAQYAASGLEPPAVGPAELAAHLAASAPAAHCHGENLAFSHVGDRDLPYWADRELADAAGRSTVPVLWSHGFLDANTKPDNILPLWERLRGPKRIWLSQMVHGGPPWARDPEDGETRFDPEVLRWLDEHVRGEHGLAADDEPVWVQDDRGRYRPEAQWPPADGRRHAWPLLAGEYLDLPGNHGERCGPQNVDVGNEPCGLPVPTGVGTWTFTPPLPHDAHLSGVPEVTVELALPAPRATLIALLYDVAPDGKARLISRGATQLGLESRAALSLYPQDWVIEEGHRLGILLSGADDTWFDPGHTGQPVQVTAGAWSATFLQVERSELVQGLVIDRLVGLFGPIDRRIDVSPSTIEQRTVPAPPPPPQEPRDQG